jgi:hypothetical protein
VGDSECLTRYIIEKSYYRSDKTVRHNAFMPPDNGRLSVFRISALSLEVIWELGERHVAIPRNKPLLGRADIFAIEVFSRGLEICPERDPDERHASIVRWPQERERRKMIAVELASKAKLELRN